MDGGGEGGVFTAEDAEIAEGEVSADCADDADY